MAFQSIWYQTELPEEIIDLIERDCVKFDEQLEPSTVIGDGENPKKRNSKNAWIPTDHWFAGFLWHYILRANRENFLYDLSHIDGENLQYTSYGEGEYYGWHDDASLPLFYKPHGGSNNPEHHIEDLIKTKSERIRKLSFSLQLSSPDDYEGGNLQLMDDWNKLYYAPRRRGTLILFDSRAKHRVLKVTKGTRKSIVGWVMGPRWK